VEAGSPAARAGLLASDVLLALDDLPITGADDLIRMLAGDKIARGLEVTILRNGSRQALELIPEERVKRK
jgi:S1-C subfamily serine protease